MILATVTVPVTVLLLVLSGYTSDYSDVTLRRINLTWPGPVNFKLEL
jgi:hypothetical protein